MKSLLAFSTSEGRFPIIVLVEKCSVSRSLSIAGLVTTATLSFMKSAMFFLPGSIAASGAS